MTTNSVDDADELPSIPVDRIRPLRGTMLFYREEEGSSVGIDIPVEPFDSGLDYVHQPEKTKFDLTVYLPLEEIEKLDGRTFQPACEYGDSSVYLGSAHNPVYVPEIIFHKTGEKEYRVNCRLLCDFEFEFVGKPTEIALEVLLDVQFDGKSRNDPKSTRFADLRRKVEERTRNKEHSE